MNDLKSNIHLKQYQCIDLSDIIISPNKPFVLQTRNLMSHRNQTQQNVEGYSTGLHNPTNVKNSTKYSTSHIFEQHDQTQPQYFETNRHALYLTYSPPEGCGLAHSLTLKTYIMHSNYEDVQFIKSWSRNDKSNITLQYIFITRASFTSDT